MDLVVPFVPPIILRTRKTLSKQRKDCQHHVGGPLLRDLLELFKRNLFLLSKSLVEDLMHFLKGVDAFLEALCTASFLSELALCDRLGGAYHRHAIDQG